MWYLILALAAARSQPVQGLLALAARGLLPRGFATMATSSEFYSDIVSSSGVYKYYVSGQWKESSSGKSVTNVNPSTRTTAFAMQGEFV